MAIWCFGSWWFEILLKSNHPDHPGYRGILGFQATQITIVNHWILGWRKTRKAWSVILQTTDRLVAWSNEFMPSQVNSKSWGTLKHYNFSQDNKSPSKCFRIFSLPISLAPLAFGKHFTILRFFMIHYSCTTIWLAGNQPDGISIYFPTVPHFLLGKPLLGHVGIRRPLPGLKAGHLRRRRRRLRSRALWEILGIKPSVGWGSKRFMGFI